ncbi:MAG: hypothetical protein HQL86_03610 [Magnetococcales bacterium]|nr:hypothetical protein [Magnetococcales bacterium]
MPATNPSASDALFRVQDPVQLLEIYAQEEMQRRRAANPSFDLTLHQEAVELLMSRLNASRPTVEGVA